ncbi:type IV secretion system DNA-binding domain-containing protein [Candidatus Kaiserbacteria bacterium]|nr:type IV secretion system DNA-binding domain-containing protein [Candidatus Kaiserbacteria bacterium]
MNLEKITYIGATDARGKQQAFGIKAIDRSKHMYVIGKTGMGKSVLLENMAIQDIQNGEGLAFIDPHGSTADKLLDYIPEHRMEDVIYFAPFDMNNPVAFNVMEDVGYDKRHLVVSGLMSAFKKIWEDQWSARMEYILNNALLALLEYPDTTLLDVNQMFINKFFRKKVVDYVTDPIVKSFWNEEFAGFSDRYAQEATPAIQNKIGQFTSNPLIRNIIGQPKSSFDMRDIMDNKKIFIANLSKGQMGETNADLLGSMLTTKIYLSAMSRADESAAVQAKLPPFYFYVDEFQSIANDSFADILSEARKYKLALTIAHQYVAQMEDNVRDAVFGNAGTIIAFRVGPFDAEVLETVFQPKFFAEDIVNLGKYQVYLTLMIDGAGSPPFSASTLPPIKEPSISFKEQILSMSKSTYGRPREQIEEALRKRGEGLVPQKPAPPKQESGKNSGQDNKPVYKPPQRSSQNSQSSSPQSRPGQRSEPKEEINVEQKSKHVQKNEENNKKENVPRKEKQTVSLNALKFKQQHDNKGPSPEQRSLLREALESVQKTSVRDTDKETVTPEKKPEHTSPQKSQHRAGSQSEQRHIHQKPADRDTDSKEVPREILEGIFKDDKPNNT